METDVLNPDNLCVEALRAIFDAAMFDYRLDKDGDLIVRETHRILVTISSKKNFICFRCAFVVKENAGIEAGIALCNRINDEMIVIRASMPEATTLVVDWYLPVAGGIPKKTVVLALRRFNDIVRAMVKLDDEDIIE